MSNTARVALLTATLFAAPTTVWAKPQFGMVCEVDFPGQRHQSIHFSLDVNAGQYTARIGNQIIKQQQEFQLDMAYGANLQPSVRAAKLVWRNPPGFYFVIIDIKNMVWVATLNGSNQTMVGFCRDDTFIGLSQSRLPPNNTAAVAASPASRPTVATPLAAQPSSPGSERLTQIGEWRIIVKDGRSIAMAKAVSHQGDQLAGLNLECVAGGRLEYLAVALKLFDPIRTLWINSAGDVYKFNLVKGRASGSAAVAISKQVLAEEAAYLRQGSGEKWTLEMSIDSDNGPMSEIQMGGFSKMRSYMLTNCKN